MVDDVAVKSSPFHFDIYQCPRCGNVVTVEARRLVRLDQPCGECGTVELKDYELRKTKDERQ